MMNRPNILLIVADQLAASALRCYGSDYGATPNIDRIVARAVRFERAYTPTPLCQPARASFWTGRWPHQGGVRSNGNQEPVVPVPADIPTVGSSFRDAGYTPVHFGKTHDAGGLRGFDVAPVDSRDVEAVPGWMVNYDTQQDRATTENVTAWLRGYADEAPYLCVADLNNPHNICGWIGDNAGPHTDEPVACELPTLPANLVDEDLATRPPPIQYLCCAHVRQSQTAGWTAENWRYYRAAYHHYIQRLDAEVGLILDALESREDADDTAILFMADHGDGMGAHGIATKHTAFYEEISRVPLLVALPGSTEATVNTGALVSLLDLYPTLCGIAGIDAPEGLWGRDLEPWIHDPARDDSPRSYVACEWHTEWGFTVEPGRMIATDRYKYTHYLEGDSEELYDLDGDPLETTNLAGNPRYVGLLEELRETLAAHVAATDDDYFSLTPKVDPRWRSHPPGTAHHDGPAAPRA